MVLNTKMFIIVNIIEENWKRIKCTPLQDGLVSFDDIGDRIHPTVHSDLPSDKEHRGDLAKGSQRVGHETERLNTSRSQLLQVDTALLAW